MSCQDHPQLGARGPRWFSTDSFWNLPIPSSAPTDTRSDRWIGLLQSAHDADPSRCGLGLHLNLHAWTLPVYHATPETPRRIIRPKLPACRYSQGHLLASRPFLHDAHPLGIHASIHALGGIPIPDAALTDAEADAHLVIVAPHENRIYDLWQCRPEPDGSWSTNAAICYPLDGPGVFTPETIAGIHNDESVHFYGPCRAPGVPAAAGLIRRDELLAGEIRHKLAFACEVAALQEHVFPAIWTDGWLPGGLPEGCILQLDPTLDLKCFDLSPAARAIARALQTYGAVLVDNAGGVTLYGEWLGPAETSDWRGLLTEEDLFPIPFEHYRILETGPVTRTGSHPVYHHEMSGKYYAHIRTHGPLKADAATTPGA